MNKLRDAIAENLEKTKKQTEEKSKEISEYNMFRKVAVDMAKHINVSLYRELKEDDYKGSVHAKVQKTCIKGLQVLTGFHEASSLFVDNIFNSLVYHTFLEYAKKQPTTLIFKVTGVGMMVMFMSDDGEVIPGIPRIIVYSKDDGQNIYVMRLEDYKKEFK